MHTLLREPGVIDDQRICSRQLRVESPRETREQFVLGPGRLRQALLKPLTHSLDFTLFGRQPPNDWLHAPTLTIEKKAFDVASHRVTALDPAHHHKEIPDELGQLCIKPSKLLGTHRTGRLSRDHVVNCRSERVELVLARTRVIGLARCRMRSCHDIPRTAPSAGPTEPVGDCIASWSVAGADLKGRMGRRTCVAARGGTLEDP